MKTLLSCILFAALSLSAQTLPPVTLVWDPSPSPDVTGYKIYWQTNAAMTNWVLHSAVPTTNTIIVHNASTGITRTNMPAQRVQLNVGWIYRFYVTATNAPGLESEPSNVLIYSAPIMPAPPSGVRMVVEWSTNLVSWTPAEIMLPGNQQLAYFRLKGD